MLLELTSRGEEERQVVSVAWDYANTVGIDAQISILIDPLSTLMCLVVAGVSTLIHLYSVAYMGGDRGYTRFFAYLNFFVFSMLLLVLAANFFLLIIGWAFVGAASYFLISFWYRRKTATHAGIKAFVINVLGDVGLVLGTYFVFGHGHAGLPQDVRGGRRGRVLDEPARARRGLPAAARRRLRQVRPGPAAHLAPGRHGGPDAGLRADPRRHDGHRRRVPDRASAPALRARAGRRRVGAVIGGLTLFIAATIGLVVTDLKRVIAYSTMSQIGYMIMAVCSAAYAAGMFHLMTHAFFKALLFMAAGSVIAAMGGNQNLDRMGGFRKVMPFTYGCMIVGGLSLAGIPPFSGFWSKDEIIALEFERGGWHTILAVLGYLGALLTAIYTFRMIFRAFHGPLCPEAEELEHGHLYHAPEPTKSGDRRGRGHRGRLPRPGAPHRRAARHR